MDRRIDEERRDGIERRVVRSAGHDVAAARSGGKRLKIYKHPAIAAVYDGTEIITVAIPSRYAVEDRAKTRRTEGG